MVGDDDGGRPISPAVHPTHPIVAAERERSGGGGRGAARARLIALGQAGSCLCRACVAFGGSHQGTPPMNNRCCCLSVRLANAFLATQ